MLLLLLLLPVRVSLLLLLVLLLALLLLLLLLLPVSVLFGVLLLVPACVAQKRISQSLVTSTGSSTDTQPPHQVSRQIGPQAATAHQVRDTHQHACA